MEEEAVFWRKDKPSIHPGWFSEGVTGGEAQKAAISIHCPLCSAHGFSATSLSKMGLQERSQAHLPWGFASCGAKACGARGESFHIPRLQQQLAAVTGFQAMTSRTCTLSLPSPALPAGTTGLPLQRDLLLALKSHS